MSFSDAYSTSPLSSTSNTIYGFRPPLYRMMASSQSIAGNTASQQFGHELAIFSGALLPFTPSASGTYSAANQISVLYCQLTLGTLLPSTLSELCRVFEGAANWGHGCLAFFSSTLLPFNLSGTLLPYHLLGRLYINVLTHMATCFCNGFFHELTHKWAPWQCYGVYIHNLTLMATWFC